MTKIDWTKPLEIHLAYNHTWVPCKVVYKYEALGRWTYIVSYDWGGFERVSHFDEDTGGVRNKPVPMVEKTVWVSVWSHPNRTWSVTNLDKAQYDETVEYYKKSEYTCLGEFANVVKYPKEE